MIWNKTDKTAFAGIDFSSFVFKENHVLIKEEDNPSDNPY